MNPMLAATLAQGATDFAGSGTSGLFGWISARKTREYNERMWDKQNAYNHPVQQMARLKEAGLNPNMVYGGGPQGATGMASEIPRGQQQLPQISFGNPMDAMLKYQQIKQSQAQESNLTAALGGIKADSFIKDLDKRAWERYATGGAGKSAEGALTELAFNKRVKTHRDSYENIYFGDYYKKKWDNIPELVKLELDQASALLTGKALENAVLEVKKDWIKNIGITEHDELWQRAVMQSNLSPALKRMLLMTGLGVAAGKQTLPSIANWTRTARAVGSIIKR